MNHLILSAILGLGAAATPAWANRQGVEQAAQTLRRDLNQLSQVAQNVANNANTNGNRQRAQRFQDLAIESNTLAQDVRQFVLRPLQQGASQAELRRSARSLDERRVQNAVRQINQIPDNVQRSLRDARVSLLQLRHQLDADWGNGGGGGGGLWLGDCRVVLETIWGTDLQSFYGRGRGASRQGAINEAREDGANQCTSSLRFGRLTRCTVDQGQCNAQRRH